MKMTKTKRTKTDTILIGMITNDRVLSAIASHWEGEPFRSRFANIVGNWCVDHYNKYDCAPKKDIGKYFAEYEQRHPKSDTIELISKFLSTISKKYEQGDEINPKMVIDEAAEEFTCVAAERLSDKLSDLAQDNRPVAVEEAIASWKRSPIGQSALVDPADETEFAFLKQHEEDVVLRYPGDAGKLFNDTFSRSKFITFMGPEKRGKSFWLMDVAYRAMINRKRVLFFEMGDMSEDDRMRRFWSRVSGLPIKAGLCKYPTTIERPDEPGECASVTHTEQERRAVNAKAAKASLARMKRKMGMKDSYIRFKFAPSMTCNVDDVQNEIRRCCDEGWHPDAVVIDYADIMAPPAGTQQLTGRDQSNVTWGRLRGIAIKYNCCVVSATQADAASYDKAVIGMSNFSEDKRKLGHVTAMFGLNQTKNEKDAGVMRINSIVVRDNFSSAIQVAHVATCLEIGNPAVKSTL